MNPVTDDPGGAPRGLRDALRLTPRSWLGATYCLLTVGTLMFLGTLVGPIPASPVGWLINLAFAALLWVASLLLGSLVVKLSSQFQRIPERSRWLSLSALFLVFMLLHNTVSSLFNVLGLMLLVWVVTFALGAGIGALSEAKIPSTRRRYALFAMILGGAGILAITAWVIWPGPAHQQVQVEGSSPAPLLADDPSQVGPYAVRQMTYGSGTDRHRQEYGADVTIQTPSVDVSSMVDGYGGIVGWLRTMYWGFDLGAVPLNARVWYPDGEGPYPLVLMVHGNHSMYDFSDPGYAYLGELLASRGFIVASVDQNFLNGSGASEIVGSLRNENDARAYLVLRHLELWHRWNRGEQDLFAGRVDTTRIALVGHSRGGEAVAIAAAFNDLPAHPGDASMRFDFGYDIRSLVAIAPSDGQYQPRRQRTSLQNVDYLVLQGSADGDVRSFVGSRQYDRVSFSDDPGRFKAAIYVHGANHGQFNTRWGRVDVDALLGFLNRGGIIPAAQQEQVAKVFISSFLEATLRGQSQYEALFENPMVGHKWLPGGVYLSQYQSSDTLMLATFEEDLDLETATAFGGRISGDNLAVWREEPLALGGGALRDTMSVHLGWDHDHSGTPSYEIHLSRGLLLDQEADLTFCLANSSPGLSSIDLTIEVYDAAGERARLPLSHVHPLPPPFSYRMFKPPLKVAFEWEPVFTTYTFPLADFLAENPALDLNAMHGIRFVFDRFPKGQVIVDNVGIRRH